MAELVFEGNFKVGVVADTHVPDRVQDLHPGLLDKLHEQGVKIILHAGDICYPGVIDRLKQVAPVIAIRGNRDLLFVGKLPVSRLLTMGRVQVALMHGQGSWFKYIWDKMEYMHKGYRLERYHNVLHGTHPEAQVVVFGHTHHPLNIVQKDRLLFNPGSATVPPHRGGAPSFGVLHFSDDGVVLGEIILLRGAVLRNHTWA